MAVIRNRTGKIMKALILVLGLGILIPAQAQNSARTIYTTNTQGQTQTRIDSRGYITNTRGQTVGRIDQQGYITNTSGQTVGRQR